MPINLKAAVEQVSREYFGGKFHPRVRWGTRAKKAQRKGMFLCAYYEASEYRITVNPILKSPRVPRGVLLYLLYHEMLHIAWGGPGHSQGFREADKSHPDYWRADKWLGENLVGLATESARR